MWYTHTHKYYSAIKKNEIMPCAATWRDLEIIILSKSDNHSYVESKKLYKLTYLQNGDRLTDIENKLMRNSLAIL